jgi:hypothetical protein
MNRRLAGLLVMLLVSTLPGCAGTPVSGSASVAEVSDKAIVIVSITHDIEAGMGADAIFYLDEGKYPGRAVLQSVNKVLTIPQESEFADRRGHLYILEVDPGPHQFDGWQVHSGGIRIFPKTRAKPLQFTVDKGQAVYVGNLHAQLVLGRKVLFGARLANGATPTVQDRSAQDIALAESRSPALKGRIRTALLPLGPWVTDGETVQRTDPLPVPYVPKK